ncbi:MAG: hypothetical protein M9907_08665 [Burkholderiaceae bacterium]|nr:hypothetical protein [Burkholderiaceae bacterium]
MSPSTYPPPSRDWLIRLHEFVWNWLRAVEPSTTDLRFIDGELFVRDFGGWSSLGGFAGWLRLARALGALRSE